MSNSGQRDRKHVGQPVSHTARLCGWFACPIVCPLALDGRAGHVAIRAEHAAVAGLGAKLYAARLTGRHDHTRILRHRPRCGAATRWTHQRRHCLNDHPAHSLPPTETTTAADRAGPVGGRRAWAAYARTSRHRRPPWSPHDTDQPCLVGSDTARTRSRTACFAYAGATCATAARTASAGS